jgi:uncharacterized membrane protein YeaQ/YmgE (transglycosylase-associated protein family)
MIWIGWIVTGLVAGLLARLVAPGTGPQGCIPTTLLGIAGAVVAGLIGRELRIYGPAEPVSLFAAFLGAVAILFAARAVRR